MTTLRRALAFSFLERYLLIALALGSNMVLARLLTPEEIGIYSVSLAVIGIAHVLRDFGIGSFLIQEKELSNEHIRTGFGLALILGGLLFVAVNLLTPTVAGFYGEPRMAGTLRIVSCNFLVLPFCTISLALLRRSMEFQSLLYVNIAATALGVAVTLALALANYGPNSMAVGSVVANIATGIGAWTANRQRNLLLPGLSQWRRLLKFGGQSAAANIVTTVSVDINDLALGKILGFSSVAVYSRAQGLMNLFHRDVMASVRNVAFPALARSHREGVALEAQHVASVTAVTALAWPFYGFLALFALETLRLMFGAQWDAARPLVPLFCAAGAIAATSSLVLTALLACGRIDLVTTAELIFQPLRVAMIVGAALAYRSLYACALAYLLGFVIHTLLVYFIKQRCIPTSMPSMLRGLASSLRMSILCLALPAAISLHAGLGRNEPMPWTHFSAACVLMILGWLGALVLTRHPLASDPLFRRAFSWLPGLSKAPS